MKIKAHLSFSSLRRAMSFQVQKLKDVRQSGKIKYSLHDSVMSAFACMFFQRSSILSFQRQMEEKSERNNLRSLFGVRSIPNDTCLRKNLDTIDWVNFRPIFKEFISRLRRNKHLEIYRSLKKYYYCPFDATTFFSSRKIRCKKCLEYHIEDVDPSCRHQTLQAAIVCPGVKQVLPLMPEPILNEDGKKKQDCEVNAAKRLLKKLKEDYPRLPLLIGGDGLYSKQPMMESVLKEGFHYLFVAKPTDHLTLFKEIELYDQIPSFSSVDSKGRTHIYEWMNDVPINAKEKTLNTNWIRYRIVSNSEGKEKIHYQNSWVTDLEVDQNTVKELAACGRSRWKIENECFNTLKNQGYNLEHNYGHGEQNLCVNFYILILLSFFFHQIFELTSVLYQACRKKLVAKYEFWNKVRSWIDKVVFPSWESLMETILKPPEFVYKSNKIVQF
jgi:hypothetical protein